MPALGSWPGQPLVVLSGETSGALQIPGLKLPLSKLKLSRLCFSSLPFVDVQLAGALGVAGPSGWPRALPGDAEVHPAFCLQWRKHGAVGTGIPLAKGNKDLVSVLWLVCVPRPWDQAGFRVGK